MNSFSPENPNSDGPAQQVDSAQTSSPDAYLKRQEESLSNAITSEAEKVEQNRISLGEILHGNNTPEGVKTNIRLKLQEVTDELWQKHFHRFAGSGAIAIGSLLAMNNLNLGPNSLPVFATAITAALVSFINAVNMRSVAEKKDQALHNLAKNEPGSISEAKSTLTSFEHGV